MSLDLALVVEYQIPKSKIEHQTLKAKQSQKYWMLALNFRIILVGIKVASTVLYIYIWSLQISFKFCTVTDFNLYKQPSQIFNNFGQILIKSSNLVCNLTKLVTTFAWFRRNTNGIIYIRYKSHEGDLAIKLHWQSRLIIVFWRQIVLFWIPYFSLGSRSWFYCKRREINTVICKFWRVETNQVHWQKLSTVIYLVSTWKFRTSAYQGVRNVSFSENFAHVLSQWPLTGTTSANIWKPLDIIQLQFFQTVSPHFVDLFHARNLPLV